MTVMNGMASKTIWREGNRNGLSGVSLTPQAVVSGDPSPGTWSRPARAADPTPLGLAAH